MPIINQNGAELLRGQERLFNLDKVALKAVTKVANNNYYSREDTWKRVVLDYKSLKSSQTVQVLFDNLTEESPAGLAKIPLLLWGNLALYSMHIYDKANGSLTLYPSDFSAQDLLDMQINTESYEAQPSVLIQDSDDLSSAYIGEDAEPYFDAGYKVRMYDPETSAFVGSTNTVQSIVDGVITMTAPFTGIASLVGYKLRFSDAETTLDQLLRYDAEEYIEIVPPELAETAFEQTQYDSDFITNADQGMQFGQKIYGVSYDVTRFEIALRGVNPTSASEMRCRIKDAAGTLIAESTNNVPVSSLSGSEEFVGFDFPANSVVPVNGYFQIYFPVAGGGGGEVDVLALSGQTNGGAMLSTSVFDTSSLAYKIFGSAV